MTQPPLQNTRFNQLQTTVGERLLGWVTRRWRDKSVALIALFAGGYTAANVTTLYLTNCSKVSDVGLQALAPSLRNVTTLDLRGCRR